MSAITLLQPKPAVPPPRRPLDQVHDTARNQGHTEPAVLVIAAWCERFIRFHGKRHPREMEIGEVGQFLYHLAQTESDAVRPFGQPASDRHTAFSGCLRPYYGQVAFEATRPSSLLNGSHPRPVDAYGFSKNRGHGELFEESENRAHRGFFAKNSPGWPHPPSSGNRRQAQRFG
jgi:hypothetical protein